MPNEEIFSGEQSNDPESTIFPDFLASKGVGVHDLLEAIEEVEEVVLALPTRRGSSPRPR
jgi:hypothetical protein